MRAQGKMTDDSGWEAKATTGCSHTSIKFIFCIIIFCNLDFYLFFWCFLSYSDTHYLLVKPMPELGRETERHWEDYYHSCVQHPSHLPVKQREFQFGCKQRDGEDLTASVRDQNNVPKTDSNLRVT